MVKKLMGVSNSSFYYTNAGENLAFDICIDYTMKDEVDVDALTRAVNKTMKLYPEFAYRPVVHEGQIYYISNREKIPIFLDDGSVRYYGTDETAGYMFMFFYRKNGFRFHFFHGLTDSSGAVDYVNSVLFHYLKELGYDLHAPESVRISDKDIPAMSEEERMDPYVYFAGKTNVKPDPPKEPEAYRILGSDEMGSAKTYQYELSFSLSELLKLTKRNNTSVVPFLVVCFFRAIRDVYDTHGLPVVMMVPADMRRFYGTRTMSNFSNAVWLRCDDEFYDHTWEEQFVQLKKMMKSQLNREHFDKVIVNKVAQIEGFRKSGNPVTEWNKRFSLKPKGDKAFFTCAVTYPGSVDPPEEYAHMISEVCMSANTSGGNGTGIVCTSFKDTFKVVISSSYQSDKLFASFERLLNSRGLATNIICSAKVPCNRLVNEKLISV